MEAVNFHGRDDHFEGLLTGGANRGAEEFYVFEHFDERLIEAEVAGRSGNPPIFNKKQAIAGHAGHHFFVGIDFADVPEAGDEEAAIGGSDHFFHRSVTAAENQIHRRFAVFVREGETVASGLFVRGFGGSAGINEIPGNAAIHEQHLLPRNPLAIEWRALLERVINIVTDADIRSEKLLAHAFIETRALVFQSGGCEIVKEEADEIEDSGGFEDHRVTPG